MHGEATQIIFVFNKQALLILKAHICRYFKIEQFQDFM